MDIIKSKHKVDGRGGYRPNAGSKPGSKKKKTVEWERLGKFLTETGAERALEVMGKMEDEKFIDVYMKMLEYFKPKLARTEIKDADNILKPVIYLPEQVKPTEQNNANSMETKSR